MLEMLEVKQQALDVLTISSDNCMVKLMRRKGGGALYASELNNWNH